MSKCPYCKTKLSGVFRNEMGYTKNYEKRRYGDLIGLCSKCLCGFALQTKILK